MPKIPKMSPRKQRHLKYHRFLYSTWVPCGQIAQYNATSPPQGPRIIPHMLLSRQARMEGFWVGQFEDRNSHALNRLSHWVRDGALKYKEDVVVGIENSPAAFIGLLNGANLGKLVVQLK